MFMSWNGLSEEYIVPPVLGENFAARNVISKSISMLIGSGKGHSNLVLSCKVPEMFFRFQSSASKGPIYADMILNKHTWGPIDPRSKKI